MGRMEIKCRMGWDIITSSVSDFYGSNDGDDNNKRGVI